MWFPKKRFRPGLEALEGRDVPSTLTVTSPLDNGDRGTLRYDIAHAANGDTIEISPTLTAPIVLSQGELLLKKNLTIEGQASQPETISGNNGSRVFEAAANHQVTLTNLTLIDGNGLANPTDSSTYAYSGGAILNFGTLTVNNCTLSNNSAHYGGGILNTGGTLTVSNCTLSGNSAVYSPPIGPLGAGGGIWSAGSLTVSASTLSGNPASRAGGGIYNRGSLTVSNCTLSYNSAFLGGGIDNDGSSAIATIGGSTLSGDYASYGGGIYNSLGTVTVSGCALTGNSAAVEGGGIYNGAATSVAMTVGDCIFNSNSPDNIFGPYVDGGGNTF